MAIRVKSLKHKRVYHILSLLFFHTTPSLPQKVRQCREVVSGDRDTFLVLP